MWRYDLHTYKSHRFSTFTKDLKRCAEWLNDNNCKDVCMECTDKYWFLIYNILESSCKIVLAHPKYVKAIRGKKTDKKDTKWIANIFKHDLVNGNFIPPTDIRLLRNLVCYRWKLSNFIVGKKNLFCIIRWFIIYCNELNTLFFQATTRFQALINCFFQL